MVGDGTLVRSDMISEAAADLLECWERTFYTMSDDLNSERVWRKQFGW